MLSLKRKVCIIDLLFSKIGFFPNHPLALCLLVNFSCFFLAIYRFYFSKSTISKKSLRNTIRVSNSLDPDQARRSVGPDLGSTCLQKISADGKELKINK